jgi:alkyl sulfatase BDS1-like metallo-beta-lactamase superfamily hydrolase
MSKPTRQPTRALATLALVGLGLGCAGTGQRHLERSPLEKIGDLAARRMAESGDSGADGKNHSRDFINTPIEVRQLAGNVWQARGVGNTQLITTSEGHVVYDTGLSTQSAKQRRLLLEAVPDVAVTHVIVSHSHADHAGGAKVWLEPGIELVAHREFEEEQRYLKELEHFYHRRNRMLFPFMPEEPPTLKLLTYGGLEPTMTVDQPNTLILEQGGTVFEILPTPGAEGADNLTLWLPKEKIFFSGDFFGPNFPQFPNVFTMRGEKVRKPIEYIESLNQVIALEPEMIVPSHQDPIVGKEKIKADLIKMRDAVQYVHDRTMEGMNAGKTVYELMEEIRLPPELQMTQIHGRVSWAVKSIWEYYATWFHWDTTTELYHVPRSALFPEIAELAGSDALTDAAEAHSAAGQDIEAIHLLEIVTTANPDDRRAQRALQQAHLNLRDKAIATTNNTYEIDWLSLRIRQIDVLLAGED